jgi:DNA-directed RNA polymerase subunit RPC12/RpoP
MTNNNCLENIKCPACGNEDRFVIAARVMAEVTDDGADVASPKYGNGFEWDNDSYARCPECEKEATLKEFYIIK